MIHFKQILAAQLRVKVLRTTELSVAAGRKGLL